MRSQHAMPRTPCRRSFHDPPVLLERLPSTRLHCRRMDINAEARDLCTSGRSSTPKKPRPVGAGALEIQIEERSTHRVSDHHAKRTTAKYLYTDLRVGDAGMDKFGTVPYCILEQ